MANLALDLYRSLKSNTLGKGTKERKAQAFVYGEGAGSLFPVYVGYDTGKGFRAPDVTTFVDPTDKLAYVQQVEEASKEGVSLNSSPGGFGYSGWCYFLLPEGTQIPAGLDVVPSPTRRFKDHYSLRCRNTMTQVAYEGALNTLARAAIAKAVEDGRSVLTVSA